MVAGDSGSHVGQKDQKQASVGRLLSNVCNCCCLRWYVRFGVDGLVSPGGSRFCAALFFRSNTKNPQNLATREGVVMEYGVEVDSKTVFLLPMGMDRKNRCMGSSV